jgi:hypothetical protein
LGFRTDLPNQEKIGSINRYEVPADLLVDTGLVKKKHFFRVHTIAHYKIVENQKIGYYDYVSIV